jgi:hypothetical protein
MNGLIIALALFGCSDDGTYCQRLAMPAMSFASEADCMAAEQAVLQSDDVLSANYPSVYAECVPATALASLGRGPIDLTKQPFAHRINLVG